MSEFLKKYTEEQLKQLVKDGVTDWEVYRDYRVIKALAEGQNVSDVAFENKIDRRTVYRIKAKHP